jgi:hypothetical protein
MSNLRQNLKTLLFIFRDSELTIYAPLINTAPALEFKSFLGPVKWHRADRRVPFGAQKNQDFQGPTPSHLPK